MRDLSKTPNYRQQQSSRKAVHPNDLTENNLGYDLKIGTSKGKKYTVTVVPKHLEHINGLKHGELRVFQNAEIGEHGKGFLSAGHQWFHNGCKLSISQMNRIKKKLIETKHLIKYRPFRETFYKTVRNPADYDQIEAEFREFIDLMQKKTREQKEADKLALRSAKSKKTPPLRPRKKVNYQTKKRALSQGKSTSSKKRSCAKMRAKASVARNPRFNKDIYITTPLTPQKGGSKDPKGERKMPDLVVDVVVGNKPCRVVVAFTKKEKAELMRFYRDDLTLHMAHAMVKAWILKVAKTQNKAVSVNSWYEIYLTGWVMQSMVRGNFIKGKRPEAEKLETWKEQNKHALQASGVDVEVNMFDCVITGIAPDTGKVSTTTILFVQPEWKDRMYDALKRYGYSKQKQQTSQPREKQQQSEYEAPTAIEICHQEKPKPNPESSPAWRYKPPVEDSPEKQQQTPRTSDLRTRLERAKKTKDYILVPKKIGIEIHPNYALICQRGSCRQIDYSDPKADYKLEGLMQSMGTTWQELDSG